MRTTNASRREFMRLAARLSAVSGVATPFAMNLAMMNAAAAQSSDYKALVCLFLFGGNDHGNTVLATDATSWAEYQRIRSTPPDPITLGAPGSAGGVLEIIPNSLQSGRSFALHPSLTDLQALFNAGRLAIVPNVGPLIAPTTKAQYNARSVPLPRGLFSHNDQQSTWQAYAPEGARYGWGAAWAICLPALTARLPLHAFRLQATQYGSRANPLCSIKSRARARLR
jgi:uncharacterized protein (DUF1501 family)